MFSKVLVPFTFVMSALAQNMTTLTTPTTLATPTITIFLDGSKTNSFAGSIIAAGNGLTTIGLECTAGGINCEKGYTITVTEGPSMYELLRTTQKYGLTATIMESCSLGGTTTASCLASMSGADVYGEHVTETAVVTFTGTNVHFFQVPITAGAEKLASATLTSASQFLASQTATLTSSSVNAAPTVAGLSCMLVGGAVMAVGVLL